MERNPNWKGGVTSEQRLARNNKAYSVWRTAVYLADDFTCRKCGVKGAKLNAHHIRSFKEFKEDRFIVENGATLCETCHRSFHKIYGRLDFTSDNFLTWVAHSA